MGISQSLIALLKRRPPPIPFSSGLYYRIIVYRTPERIFVAPTRFVELGKADSPLQEFTQLGEKERARENAVPP